MTASRIPTSVLTSADAPKRAVIYCRISRDVTGEGRGVERQEAACRALAAARGWVVADVVIENDVSASKGTRKLYRKMIADVRAGRYDVMVSWAVDRLTRSPIEVEELIKVAEETGAIVATVSGDLDLSTDQGRLVGRILGSVARGEVERKSARQRAAYRQSAESGKPPNGRAFGYERDGAIIPTEAAIVRDMFVRYAAGESVNALLARLKAQGIPNTKGREWGRYGLTWMLRNPRYTGERHRVVKKDGVNRWEFVGPGKWEPIIGMETFQAAQARVRENSTIYTNTAPNKKHIGAGLYLCRVCGGKLKTFYQQYKLVDGTKMPGRRYACEPTRHLVRKAQEIDDRVVTKMVARLQRPDVMKALTKLQEDDGRADRAGELAELTIGYQGSLDALVKAMALPMTDPDHLDPAFGGRSVQRIQAELDKIEAESLDLLRDAHPELALIAGSPNPGKAWFGMTTTDVRAAQAIMRIATESITLLPGKRGRGPFDPASVVIKWRGPAETEADDRM